MSTERSCTWLAGPGANTRHDSGHPGRSSGSAARWWLAISRDVVAKSYRRYTRTTRAAVTCDRTPMFTSPLASRRK